jgi:hypothetical protein
VTNGNSEKTDYQHLNGKNVLIVPADGAFTCINKNQCSILFYTLVPFLKKGGKNDTDIGQREMLQVEIRMQSRHLKGMIEHMLEDVNKKLEKKNDGETVTSDMGMFA